jgi:hypothetical protein
MPVHDRNSFESLYTGQPRWEIQSIEPSRYEVRPDPNDVSFKDGGPKAWFVVAKRV